MLPLKWPSWKRLLIAYLAGYVAASVLLVFTTEASVRVAYRLSVTDPGWGTRGSLLVILGGNFIAFLLGGAVVGALAAHRPIMHAGILGLAMALVGVVLRSVYPGGLPLPTWVFPWLALNAVVASAVGGALWVGLARLRCGRMRQR